MIIFQKKHFSEKIFEKESCEGIIFFFDRVFRRHHTWNDPVNWIDPLGTAGAYVSIGGQIVAPGGSGSASVGGYIGNDASGAIVIGGGGQISGTPVSGGAVKPSAGFEFGVFFGSTNNFAAASTTTFSSPFGGISIFHGSNGDFTGVGFSGKSRGIGMSFTPSNSSFNLGAETQIIGSSRPGTCPVK